MNELIINKTQWLNIPSYYEQYKNDGIRFWICVGYNSIGKTYGVEDYFVDLLEKGEHCCWVRNTCEEAKKCVSGWVKALDRKKVIDKYRVKRDGIYIKAKKQCDDKLMCPFIYLSSPDSSIPQFENVRAYCWDEFIPSNETRAFTLKDVKKVLTKMTNRTARGGDGWFEDTEIPFFFLSNLNSLESDFLASAGIDLDYEKLYNNIDQIEIDKDKHRAVMIFPTEWDIPQIAGQKTYWGKFWEDQESIYPIPHPSLKRIYPFRPLDFTFLYNITFMEKEDQISVLSFMKDGERWLYVEKTKRDFITAINYCFYYSDGNANNVMIRHEDAKQYLTEIFECKLDRDHICYQSPWAKELLMDLLDDLQSSSLNDD